MLCDSDSYWGDEPPRWLFYAVLPLSLCPCALWNLETMMIVVPSGLIPPITGCTPAFDIVLLSGPVTNRERWAGTGSGEKRENDKNWNVFNSRQGEAWEIWGGRTFLSYKRDHPFPIRSSSEYSPNRFSFYDTSLTVLRLCLSPCSHCSLTFDV